MSAKRVLIFDSGVGGLSVYEQIVKYNPTIKCQYLFDNAYFPYGELPREQLIHRLTQLLTEFMQLHSVDLIVIACNSASTVALDALRLHFTIPIVGVVPAIKPATLITANNVIGLLATPGTIERAYTDTLINEFAADKTVLRIGSTQLVKLAEDKLIGKVLDVDSFRAILAPWLKNEDNMPDTLVLGCTHFPLLKEEISACFARPVHLVDSGQAIALRVKQLLNPLSVDEQLLDEQLSSEQLLNDPLSSSQLLNNYPLNNYPLNKYPLNHQAFYTRQFESKAHLTALTMSFKDRGFLDINFCGL